MIYYLAKFAQATGLIIILVGFLQRLPKLMNPKIFMAGLLVFAFGWIVERFILKR